MPVSGLSVFGDVAGIRISSVAISSPSGVVISSTATVFSFSSSVVLPGSEFLSVGTSESVAVTADSEPSCVMKGFVEGIGAASVSPVSASGVTWVSDGEASDGVVAESGETSCP